MGAAGFEELTVDALAQASIRSNSKANADVDEGDNVEYLTYQGIVLFFNFFFNVLLCFDGCFCVFSGVMGRPGIDFPVLPSIPNTGFNCKQVATGYYADLDTDCQVVYFNFYIFFISKYNSSAANLDP